MNQSPFTILVIDDDEDDQIMFSEAIERIGPPLVCDNAFSGQKALGELISGGPIPDVIFLDAYIRDMDALDCLKFLKQHDRFSAIPVIVIDGTQNEKLYHQMMQAGALHYYEMPSLFSELIGMINSILREVMHVNT